MAIVGVKICAPPPRHEGFKNSKNKNERMNHN